MDRNLGSNLEILYLLSRDQPKFVFNIFVFVIVYSYYIEIALNRYLSKVSVYAII